MVLTAFCINAKVENSKFFVFIGEKISIELVPPKEGKISMDRQYLAKYKILKSYKGTYDGSEIEFTVFNHYGFPRFPAYEHVLLYVVQHEGKYYHSKYQFSPLFKTKNGKWAGPYPNLDYAHSYNRDTTITPRIIEFAKPALIEIDLSKFDEKQIKEWYPEPYYKHDGKSVVAIYGNYLDELFLLKQNGFLKARNEFQEF